jgi:hypothetical protein
MAQSAVDLPDPLHKPPLGANPSEDELLSQLAGDEIDRLLTEAGTEKVSAETAEPPTLAAAPAAQAADDEPLKDMPAAHKLVDPVSDPELAQQLDDVLGHTQVQSDAAASAAAEEADSVPGNPEISRQLDSLFKELTGPAAQGGQRDAQPASAPSATVPAAPPASATAPEGQAQVGRPHLAAAPNAAALPESPPTAAGSLGSADQISQLERQVLSAEVLSEVAGPTAAKQTAGGAAEQLGQGRQGNRWYLLPLEWLDAPLAHFPQTVREAIGKIAIVTLVNALAILLYVLIFGPLR